MLAQVAGVVELDAGPAIEGEVEKRRMAPGQAAELEGVAGLAPVVGHGAHVEGVAAMLAVTRRAGDGIRPLAPRVEDHGRRRRRRGP